MQNNTFFGHSKASSLIVLDNVSSTNDSAKELLSKFKPQLPFTVIMAKKQTAGKGQRGTHWLATPMKNLTASYIYIPENLEIKNQFAITIISSLAVYDTLESIIEKKISIKWPNDIMIDNKKIAGILIENKITSTHIKNSIIGIGLNVNSIDFPKEIIDKSTSVKIENSDFKLTIIDIAKRIQKKLIKYQHYINENKLDELWKLYELKLFRINIEAKFKINESIISATILGVNKNGSLKIQHNNEILDFNLKEIEYCL